MTDKITAKVAKEIMDWANMNTHIFRNAGRSIDPLEEVIPVVKSAVSNNPDLEYTDVKLSPFTILFKYKGTPTGIVMHEGGATEILRDGDPRNGEEKQEPTLMERLDDIHKHVKEFVAGEGSREEKLAVLDKELEAIGALRRLVEEMAAIDKPVQTTIGTVIDTERKKEEEKDDLKDTTEGELQEIREQERIAALEMAAKTVDDIK
jgi:hypothetical protein